MVVVQMMNGGPSRERRSGLYRQTICQRLLPFRSKSAVKPRPCARSRCVAFVLALGRLSDLLKLSTSSSVPTQLTPKVTSELCALEYHPIV